MNKIIITILILFLLILFFILDSGMKKRLNKYWSRSTYSAAKKWKELFPTATNNEIREYLETFVDGFAFKSSNRLKFEPDDKVMKVYQTIYGTETPWSDVLELETFCSNLEEKYSVNLEKIWHEEITLGQIFTIIKKSQQGHIQ